jgi:predicted HD superfamily hydrolase involved in NAD metabolism
MDKEQQEKLEQIRHWLKKELKKERYIHTMGVTYTAAALAMAYGENVEKALFAGLLHDCAKGIKPLEQLRLCEKYGIEITPFERKLPYLLHTKLGAYFAKTKYGVDDEEVLHAIKVHTTGEPNMNTLDKIIFMADYIEPHRKQIPYLDEIRRLAFYDLNQAMYRSLRGILEHLKGTGNEIDPTTSETFNYFEAMSSTKN